MPTGNCRYPDHHTGPSASQPVALLVLIALGALIIANWHTMLVCLAVVAVLAVAAGIVGMLVHAHRAEPYDTLWRPSELPAAAHVTVTIEAQMQKRIAQLERELASRQIAPPATTVQHLHLHGVTAEDVAAIIARRNAIEE